MATDWHLANSLIQALTQRQRDQVDGLMAQLQATERALSSDRAAGDAMAQGHVGYLACPLKAVLKVKVALIFLGDNDDTKADDLLARDCG